ncbi:Alpha/Beta hydrolase fold [Lasallia pustulata]|uniref:Alpha/Beta hydrolase fold n=1 Tax=Lasallia pustulata TaxID=136370 RepID=A0A1W5DE27_9LECA|nr:Alpha/Beta hydrolase fold [Lasallia pustulata]
MAHHVLGGYRTNTTRPTIILVHGGWQGPSSFSLLVPRLEKAGYSVFAPTLPSAATEPALPSFDEDVKIVHNALQSVVDTGKKVIVVMHSYGAVVGCEALRGVKVKDLTEPLQSNDDLEAGGVVKLVFLCGMVLPVGGSIWKTEKGNDPVPGFECVDNLITITDAPNRFYNDLPPHSAAYWTSKMRAQSRLAYSSQLTYAAYRHIPCSYLICTRDQALPLKVQERMVAMAGIKETERVEAGHLPHISQPGFVERFIRKSAGEFLSML